MTEFSAPRVVPGLAIVPHSTGANQQTKDDDEGSFQDVALL